MKGLDFTLFGATGATSGAYEAACRAAIDSGTKWKLALVQVPSDTKGLQGDENPYLVTKAKFLSRGISVQEFRPETMNKGTRVHTGAFMRPGGRRRAGAASGRWAA